MKHWTGIFIMHVLQVLKIFAGFSCAVFLGVVVYCTGLLFTKPGKLLSDPEIVFSLATIVLYSAGYCLVHVEERFFMIVCFLFMPLGGYLLDNIFRKNFLKTGRNALLILLVLSFAVVPVPQLTKNVNADKEIYLLGDAMRKYVPPHSRIAASGYWYESLYVAFHLQSAIYGTTEQLQAGAAKQELDRYAVNYFIDWGSHGDTSLFLTAFIETGKAEYNDRAVTVYKRKDG